MQDIIGSSMSASKFLEHRGSVPDENGIAETTVLTLDMFSILSSSPVWWGEGGRDEGVKG